MTTGGWGELEQPAPASAVVDGIELRRGSRVVLRPRAGADVFDLALTGRLAMIDGFEQDVEGKLHAAVTVDDDPGRDLGTARQPGHRFFFSLEEVEPLAGEPVVSPLGPRVLLAGIGNMFLGDDAFGVELARRLAERRLPAGVEVVDFGIRGMDLAYAMQDGYDAVVFLDAVPRGEAPGTLYVIEPEIDEGLVGVDTHGMDPVKVLALARTLGTVPDRILVVGCEPETRMSGDADELLVELSAPVRAALDEAVTLVESVLEDLVMTTTGEEGDRQ